MIGPVWNRAEISAAPENDELGASANMELKFLYITNDPQVARVAESCGVDRIFVDLETLGKAERQKNMNAVLSYHTLDDVKKIKSVLTKSQLLTRVNPINPCSKAEIDEAIANGTDLIMLPMFKTREEVQRFAELVGGRVRTVCLVETREAAEAIDEIASVVGIDEYHVGLNDMHLSYGLKNMFELLVNGVVDRLCEAFKKANKPFGIGGVARVNRGDVPANYILSEHCRLGSSGVILSRSFYNTTQGVPEDVEAFRAEFQRELNKICKYEAFLSRRDAAFYADTRELLRDAILEMNSRL